jgi:hypothetical protein
VGSAPRRHQGCCHSSVNLRLVLGVIKGLVVFIVFLLRSLSHMTLVVVE